MGKLLLLLVSLFSFGLASEGQLLNPKIVFVIDSIPLRSFLGSRGQISPQDVAEITYVSGRDKLKKMGWEKVDTVFYVTTKEYRNRPDSIKRIPSLRQMKMEDSVWLINDIAYTGQYIDYYNSGRKQSEGTIVNGRLDGKVTYYFQDGRVKNVTDYNKGTIHGWSIEYYENGNLACKTQYTDGQMKGLNETYFLTGQVRTRSIVNGTNQKDTTFSYYSTGKLKEMIIYINRYHPIRSKKQEELDDLSNKYFQNLKAGNIEAAYKSALELVEFDTTRAEAYVKKGFILFRKYFFDKAISEFDKALEIEPLFGEAYACRALARIHKYQSNHSGLLTKSRKKASPTSWKLDPIPTKEQGKVCFDLQQAAYYGFNNTAISKFIQEAWVHYCHKGSSR